MQMNEETFEDLLSVIYLGTDYWADFGRSGFNSNTGVGEFELIELDEMGDVEDVHLVTTEQLLDVLNRIDREGGSAYNVSIGVMDVLRRHNEEDFMVHVDAEVADCWLQLAVFGEIVYA